MATNDTWTYWTMPSSSSTTTDTQGVWQIWTDNSTTCASATNVVWREWCNVTNTITSDSATSITTGSNTDGIWREWCACTGTANNGRLVRIPETEAQRQERLRREEEYRREQEKKEKERKEADERAMKLFRDIVGEEQAKLFEKRNYHEMVGPSGRRYRLRLGRTIAVMKDNFGETVEYGLCIHHPGWALPKMDTLIHQMLLIMSGREDVLHRVANRHAA